MAKRGTIPRRTGEEWKQIQGEKIDGVEVTDFYVSNFGRVRRDKRILKQALNNDGYPSIWIGKKRLTVHRLVATYFVPNPENKPVVDHINGNKEDNRAINLRWLTIGENTQAAYDNNLYQRGEVVAIDDKCNVHLYKTQIDASKATGVDKKSVNLVIRGIYNSVKGWKFFRMKAFTDHRKEGKRCSTVNGADER